MNRRQRALRNRQDRSKLYRQMKSEAQEPKLEEIAKESVQEDAAAASEPKLEEIAKESVQEDAAAVSEPKLDINKEIKSSEEAKPADSVVSGMSSQDDVKDEVKEEVSSIVTESVASIEQDESLESGPSFSATDIARNALKANYEQKEDVSETAVTETAVLSNIVQEPPETPETSDDPDKVPVATTLTDEEVPNKPGAILMHAREILGLTQRQVAYKLNARVNVISDIEHDRLNQVTAIPFASAHIANYARLVNIDPKLLVSLYKENVQKVVSEQAYAQKKNQSAEASMAVKKLVKAALIAIIVIGAIAFGVSYFASGSEEESSGALVIEDTVQATTDNDGSLSIDTENSKMKSNMVPVEDLPAVEDPNTQLAKKQAMSMDTNAIISNQNEKANGEVSDAQDSLVLKGQAAVNANNGAAIIEEEPLLEENTLKTVSIDDGKVSYKDSKNQKKDTLSLKTENTTVKTEKLKTDESAKKADAAKKAEADAARQKAISEEKKAIEAKKAEEPKAVALASSLRDISSQVRLSKADPLGSVNTVQIKVKGDVSLKITANGKVVKQGTFKAGDTVSAIGIPPFAVGVTDSSKIQINYKGGSVAVPAAKQVKFTLPQR